MHYKIANAPCSWGVEEPDNIYNPSWINMLDEAHRAGYTSIELGPYGYLPTDPDILAHALHENELTLIAGTLLNDLVSVNNFDLLMEKTHKVCSLISQTVKMSAVQNLKYPPPYLVIIDFGHPEKIPMAGQVNRAPRLSNEDWMRMIFHIKEISRIAWYEYGVRPVIHPHAGGYIEFSDEITNLVQDIPYETAGLCLDTGHLYYSGMDPLTWLNNYKTYLDYIHFKDINKTIYSNAISNQMGFYEACADGVMCPIGTGDINYLDIKKLLDEIQYQGWITIEQDRDPRDITTRFSDVSDSLKFLRTIGF